MTNRIALLVVTSNADLSAEGLVRETMLFPTSAWTRVTDGVTKGKQFRWTRVTNGSGVIDSVDAWEFAADQLLAHPVVGVRLSDIDESDLAGTDWAGTAATKARTAASKVAGEPAPVVEDVVAFVADLFNKVAVQDADVARYVRDARFVSADPAAAPVRRLSAVPAQTPAPAAPVAAPAAPVLRSALATVPDKSFAKSYINRKLAGDIDDFRMLDYALESKQSVLLLGDAGSGKTTLPIAWAAARGLRCYSVAGNAALEPRNLFGGLVPDSNGNWHWVDGAVTDLVRHGGVLILDELTVMSPKILTVLYPLLDSRRQITLLDHEGEVIDAHPDLLIVATGNVGYAGTVPMSHAMRDRFALQFRWDYDEKVEAKLVPYKYLRTMVNDIRSKALVSGIDTPIGTRMLMEFAKNAQALGWAFASEVFVQRFADEEQPQVRLVVDTHAHNIKSELGLEVERVETELPVEEEVAVTGAPWEFAS